MTGESRARFFINTYKDPVNFSGASLRQYTFLQIVVYSMQKYPLQAYSTRLNPSRFALFTFKQKENLCTYAGSIECLVISDR